MYIYYATTIGDSEKVVEHWVLEEDWSKAIEIINRQVTLFLCQLFTSYTDYTIE